MPLLLCSPYELSLVASILDALVRQQQTRAAAVHDIRQDARYASPTQSTFSARTTLVLSECRLRSTHPVSTSSASAIALASVCAIQTIHSSSGAMKVFSTDPQPGVASVNPKPQCAFEECTFAMSCNSRYVSHFAAFFIDPRAE
jgi:hypothetical protein